MLQIFSLQSSFQNLDLLTVGIAVAAIGILGYITYFNNKYEPINRSFFTLCLTAILWSVFNYLSYQINNIQAALWLLKLAIFFAVWFSYFISLFFYIYPKSKYGSYFIFRKFFTPLTVVVSLLTLTPLVFKEVVELTTDGKIGKISNGPGIFLFGATVISLLVYGTTILIKKIKGTRNSEKNQLLLILLGITITSVLLIIFNFILPAFFNIPRFIAFGGVFLFPFISFTAYAIFKHKLFNVKIIAAEILTFILSITALLEVILSDNWAEVIFRACVFLFILSFGILLSRSVKQEVKQREKLQQLAHQLESANLQLKALDQARAEFISIASHQLRTPPATIKWYLGALLSGDYGRISPQLKPILEKTQITNNGLIASIEDMLNVSRIERGKMEFLFKPANVQSIAKAVFDQLYPIAMEKKLTMTLDLPKEPLPEIMADGEKLRQVMNNLIDNSIKYTKQGSVTVRLFADKGNIRFEVIDSGKGISRQDTKNIFEKFKRGKESIAQSAGLGLGLYVAKVIIAQHKGKIWVESEGVGKGSKFIFTLPIKNNLKPTTILDLAK